ncbi:ATP-binding protein [Streptomyces hesseae]|uniref:ATP-binding protein n=1 Tax=Streptomyces hesseae TaxID=3075519 RepID=A0ABU2SNL8_9ACTN|nr:ATP-binding protein [Streptomyces sp. DSM 40473]MDT0450576.1 ATP-binding protein [Streptomyces sp. DSM 40473]
MATPLHPDCTLAFPPHPAWVRAAREAVRTLLAATRRPDLEDAAVSLTSEAVTNAIKACQAKACRAHITLSAEWADPQHLRVFVHDGAAGLPLRRRLTSLEDESGRGLMLIEHEADAWGVCTHGPGPGKATWFVLGGRDRDRSGLPAKSPAGCLECKELVAARRAADTDGDQEKVTDAIVAIRSHFRDAHILPAWPR